MVRDASGQALGYDINEDQAPDIPLQRVSSYSASRSDYPEESWRMLKGSSYAAPTEVRRRAALRSASVVTVQ